LTINVNKDKILFNSINILCAIEVTKMPDENLGEELYSTFAELLN
jgi:hypothetical protein